MTGAGAGMTRREREDVLKLVRARAKLAQGALAARSAQLRLDFERQMQRTYSFNESKVWRRAHAAAEAAITKARGEIAAEAEKLGIPAQFAPTISGGWIGGGEQLFAKRQAALRKIAHAEIEVSEKRAKVAIERAAIELQTEVIAGGLTSNDAKAFVERLLRVEALMAPLDFKQIEGKARVAESGEREMFGLTFGEDDND